MTSLTVLAIFAAIFVICFEEPCAATATGQNAADVHPTILEERRKLQSKEKHFVGKIDTLGTLKHSGRKQGKAARPANPQLIVWNGTAKVIAGILPTDQPEPLGIPSDIAGESKFNSSSCLKGGKTFPAYINSDHVNAGPKADGMKQDDFAPCAENHVKTTRARTRLGSFAGRRFKRADAYSYSSMLWKSPRPMLAALDDSVPPALQMTVKRTAREWEKHTCLHISKLASSMPPNETAHILFTAKGGPCGSDRIGPHLSPPRPITVDVSNCGDSIGGISHAIGHALGLGHSHRRSDRDASIKVFEHNVAEAWKPHFEKHPDGYFDSRDVPYRYDSVMHYSAYAASKNGLMTICPLDPLMEVRMGQREEPAFEDFAVVNRMYCTQSCYDKAQLKSLNFTGDLTRTISGRRCQNWSTQAPHKHNFTSVGNHRNCRNPDDWEGGPWCFTTDPRVPYEPCIPACENRGSRYFCKGWCYNGGYHPTDVPERCGNCVCPKYATGPHCENVNKTNDHLPCGRKVELKRIGDKTTLTSGDYPNNYADNHLCMFWIEAPKGATVRLTILDFMLETPDDSGCYDYVEIRPSICAAAIEDPGKMRFCGNSLAPQNGVSKVLYSDDNNMVIKFYSDQTENAKGFKVIAEAVPSS